MLLYILPKYSSFFPVEYSSSYKVFFSINNYYKNSRSVKIKCNYSEKQKIIEQNDQTDEITTIVKSAKRHVIRLNNIEARRKQYIGESIFKSKELISGNKDIYAISIFANIYLPDNLSDDFVKFTLTINGVDYEILPINSYKNGIKMIRFSQGKMPTEYTKYIGEKITSAYLTVSIKSKNKITPYINNLKVLLGGEI